MLKVETNPYSHLVKDRGPNEIICRNTIYVTDGKGVLWQLRQTSAGLTIGTTTGSRVAVYPDCANTITIAEVSPCDT